MDGEPGVEVGAGDGEEESQAGLSAADERLKVDAGLFPDFTNDRLVGAFTRIDKTTDEVECSFLRFLCPSGYEELSLLVGDDDGTGCCCVEIEGETAVSTATRLEVVVVEVL